METLAPPVVAVVVAHDPGPWFEETLASLDSQDYAELSVLVLDAAGAEDLTARVAAVLPTAYVRRFDENRGFGTTANEVLAMVDGADYFLLCHDDVALFPDAVHLLVEEAFRSNAGIVSPKVVSWDDPDRLLHVGMTVDKGGSVVDRVQPGEIDHGQHDAVRDVFVAPGGPTLVRADLFAELGGFDTAIVAMGEDLDLCWRAQVVGARIIVAPDARVRHLEELAGGARSLDPSLVGGEGDAGPTAPRDPPGASTPSRAAGGPQVLRPVPPHPGRAPGPRARHRRGHRGRAGRQPGPGPGRASGPGAGTSGASRRSGASARSSRPTAAWATRRSGSCRWAAAPGCPPTAGGSSSTGSTVPTPTSWRSRRHRRPRRGRRRRAAGATPGPPVRPVRPAGGRPVGRCSGGGRVSGRTGSPPGWPPASIVLIGTRGVIGGTPARRSGQFVPVPRLVATWSSSSPVGTLPG